ncbi:MAG: ferredoxin [Pseudomonadales bacterium]|nr:ferredoxin [Pseudomonadales bacterium]
MKIKVDRDLCESNQLCVLACPDVFEIDDSDELVVLIENPDESLREDLMAAVNVCPRLALSIED